MFQSSFRAIIVLALASQAPSWADERTQRVDAVFADVDRTDSPGAAVAIVRGDEVLYLRGYGMASLEHGVPITPRTVFDIASVSKQFGAMTAVLLAQDGVIDLAADVRTIVPELPDFGETLSLRHLIHHTSGIRDWPHLMVLSGVEMGDVISFRQIKKMLFRQRDLNFPPGSAYAYSNTGYNLLAESLARVSGKSFRELTDERIFRPLYMRDTFFADDHVEIVPRRADSYEPDASGGFVNSTNQLTALASSSLHTTIEDFAKWMVNFETQLVGGESGLETMTRRGTLNDGSTIPYAHGLRHDTYRGLATFGHGGSWRGFRTIFLRFPGQKLSIAVFANFSTAAPQERAERIADIYLEGRLGDPEEAEPSGEPEPIPYSIDDEALAELAGTYYCYELDTTYELVVEGGGLRADHWRNESVSLRPVGPDAFRSDVWWFREIQFSREGSGAVAGFGLSGDRVHDLRFERR